MSRFNQDEIQVPSLIEKVKGIIAGVFIFTIISFSWIWCAVKAGLFIDGCPDIVMAYKPCSPWVKNMFLSFLPMIIFISIYCGLRISKMKRQESDRKNFPDI